MPHAQLTDAQWQRLEPLLLGKPVEGILRIARTGAPWRDLQSPSTRCRPGKGGVPRRRAGQPKLSAAAGAG